MYDGRQTLANNAIGLSITWHPTLETTNNLNWPSQSSIPVSWCGISAGGKKHEDFVPIVPVPAMPIRAG